MWSGHIACVVWSCCLCRLIYYLCCPALLLVLSHPIACAVQSGFDRLNTDFDWMMLFNSPAPSWRRYRHLMTPAFTTGKLKAVRIGCLGWGWVGVFGFVVLGRVGLVCLGLLCWVGLGWCDWVCWVGLGWCVFGLLGRVGLVCLGWLCWVGLGWCVFGLLGRVGLVCLGWLCWVGLGWCVWVCCVG